MRPVRGAPLLALVLLLGLVPACEAAAVDGPAPGGFVEEFDALDPQRWTPAAPHVLGRSRIDPANVRVAGGRLELLLRGGSLDGAELLSTGTLATGVVTARLRVADAPDSLTGFFLYAPPDHAHEIDIEILGDPRGRVLFTTHHDGRETHTIERDLGFDPTAAFQDYAIARRPGQVAFSVDGRELVRWIDGVPDEALHLYLNVWFPRWLGGRPPVGDRATSVDRVTHTPDGSR
ncbi:MAG: glycoside hydrolase family 16 [Actinomycetospora sp.]|nr:glycoside hydrolase family 16 [Actinomycetospora sp.]